MLNTKAKFDNVIKLITIFVFIIFFVIGLLIFDDYGVTVDEPIERQTSLVNLKFILQDLLHKKLPEELSVIPELQSYKDKYYGVLLQFPTVLFEYFTNFRYDISSIFKLRHLWTFLNFYISVIFFNL
ncbi:MAG TPA: hypothetical protein PKX37_09840, partial [Flexilinea sp.]|nr:hypothetical protein [Flexilinea sp.]